MRAELDGWQLVAIRPDGLMIYREKFLSRWVGWITRRRYYDLFVAYDQNEQMRDKVSSILWAAGVK